MRDFLTDIAILAELTFREARRRKIVWTALGLGLAFIILYGIGFYFIYRDFQQYSRGKSLALDSSMNFVIMVIRFFRVWNEDAEILSGPLLYSFNVFVKL